MFPIKIRKFPPHRGVEFFIELMAGATLASKAPYKMRTLEFLELNLHLKEMFDKGYIRESVSP